MLLKLIFTHFRQKKFRNILAVIAISIACSSLTSFLALSEGIKQASFSQIEKQTPLTIISVRKAAAEKSFIPFSNRQKISSTDIDEINKIPNIKKIYPEIQYQNFASIEGQILGTQIITDTLIFGHEAEFFANEIENIAEFKSLTEPYPTIIPRKLLDLFNLTIASASNLPELSEKSLIGSELTLYPNYSTIFPNPNASRDQIKLKIIGFSDRTKLIGVTLPRQIVEDLNHKFTAQKNSEFLEIFVETNDATNTIEVANQIEKLGYETQYYQKNLRGIEDRLKYLDLSLAIIGIIILITAAIAIISTFLGTVEERKREIGLFRALGASKKQISRLILTQALILGVCGSILGTTFGIIMSKIANTSIINKLQLNSLISENIFQFNFQIILTSIIFGTILTLICAYFPAQKAQQISPIEALK